MRRSVGLRCAAAACSLLCLCGWSAVVCGPGIAETDSSQVIHLAQDGRALWRGDYDSASMPMWRALLLVYRSIDANYTDATGTPSHLTTTLPDDQVLMAQYAFRQFPAMAQDFSGYEALVCYDVIFVDRPLTTLTSCGTNLWWPSPADTRAEMDLFAPAGTYDSVFVQWPQTDFATGQSVPSPGWGLAIQATSWSNGATYVTVANAQPSTWLAEPNVGEVWLHEWLHGVCSYYAGLGYPMPAGDADGGSGHGYVWSPTDGWGAYYRDLMTGHVLDAGSYKGITAEAWQSGSILGTRADVFADYFYTDTTASYERTGTVVWNDTYRIVDLGTAALADNRLYTSLPLGRSFMLTGRLFIPGSGIGGYDSVALAVRDAATEYWATLAYGNLLVERNNISIMENDSWGALYPLTLTTGWYTVRGLVDYEAHVIRMKAWRDGTNEPEWQTSRSLASDWTATAVGFRHYGQGTSVDDLFAIETVPLGRSTLSTIGLYNPAAGSFYLRNANSAGPAGLTFRFGPKPNTWIPVAGDWNADELHTIGLYNQTTATFYLRNANAAGPADSTFRFGPAPNTWLPVAGDWDGDGDNTIGLYSQATGTFYLRNGNSPGTADLTFRFGPTGSAWLPIVGDWDGNGIDTVGLYNPASGTFYLRHSNSGGVADLTFRFGPTASTWKPIAEDWNQDGIDTVGLYNPVTGTFYLRTDNAPGPADLTFRYGPAPSTWLPIAGDWDGL